MKRCKAGILLTDSQGGFAINQLIERSVSTHMTREFGKLAVLIDSESVHPTTK